MEHGESRMNANLKKFIKNNSQEGLDREQHWILYGLLLEQALV